MHRILSLGDMACTNGTNKGLVNVIIITNSAGPLDYTYKTMIYWNNDLQLSPVNDTIICRQ